MATSLTGEMVCDWCITTLEWGEGNRIDDDPRRHAAIVCDDCYRSYPEARAELVAIVEELIRRLCRATELERLEGRRGERQP